MTKPTSLETPTVPDWLASATPGLDAARDALDAARSALAAVKPPEGKTLADVGIRTSDTEWKPSPLVTFAEFDEVRVAFARYYHDRKAAERVLDRAVELFEGLLYGGGLDIEQVAARQAAATARVEHIDHALEHDPLTGAQRRELEAERVLAARYMLTASPSMLRTVARGGKATVLGDGGRVAAELGPDYSRVTETRRVWTSYGVYDA